MKPKHDGPNGNVEYIIYTDGGSRGNPGESAYGFVVYDKNRRLLYEEGKKIGIKTNNFAEYSAVLEALKWVEQYSKTGPINIQFFMDSMLVAEQLSGRWKVKSESIRSLYYSIKELEQKLKSETSYSHVYREQNKEADRLVNEALDKEIW